MRSPVLAFCLTLSAVAPALALDCADETQVAQDMCADASYQKADAALNRSYKEILRRLKGDSATTKLLIDAPGKASRPAHRAAGPAHRLTAEETRTSPPSPTKWRTHQPTRDAAEVLAPRAW